MIAPDGFGGTLSARQAASAIADGWRSTRPGDEVTEVPLSDGGEGFLDVVMADDDEEVILEVAGPLGHPVEARYVMRDGSTAVIESAAACGLALVPDAMRDPMRTTTYGVGQMLHDAIGRGARRILMGLGGSATVDGGAGALCGLGYRVTVSDGSGLKVGASDLGNVASIEMGWAPSCDDVAVELLSDVTTVLADAARVFGPQKGADDATVQQLTLALQRWADVVERDLAAGKRVRDDMGTGAAGGLGYALMAAIGARVVPGIDAVADLVDLDAQLDGADIVVTGEGRLDATSAQGKVIASVTERTRSRGARVMAVVGQVGEGAPSLDDVEASAQTGPGPDPATEVSAAAARLAERV
ncbi:MAG: glycerate kinase [Nitriliruptoraceae bacterium]